MTKNTGGPAFPIKDAYLMGTEQGMTLRDYFAAKAMHAIMVPNPVTGQYPQAVEFYACAIGAY